MKYLSKTWFLIENNLKNSDKNKTNFQPRTNNHLTTRPLNATLKIDLVTRKNWTEENMKKSNPIKTVGTLQEQS